VTRPVAARRKARRAVGVGVLAFVALELGLGLASEVYPRIRDPLYGDKLVKLQRRLREHPGEPVVVMLGSSRTGLAFHGRRIEDRLGGVAFNFGTPAAGPVGHLLYARRLFADGVTPSHLLVEVLPSMLGEQPDGPLERAWLSGDRLTHGELATVERYRFPAAVRDQWAAATLNPWHTLRFALLARVVQSWIPWHLRADWSRGADECGWGRIERDAITDDERRLATGRALLEYGPVLADLRPGGPAADALRELLAECRRRGVRVTLVLTPEGSAFRSWYPPHVRARLAAFLAGLRAESGCGLIDAREWLADDRFTDGHHLLVAGAEEFSDRLAEVLLETHRP
jgi:hypothetical protein